MEFEVSTADRVEVVDVTNEVADAVPDAVEAGICTVFVPHTTVGVIVNENESRLRTDLVRQLNRIVPSGDGYEHDTIDDNADAHLRASLLGESVTVPILDGKLGLGTWQSILLVECDGPRTRRVSVTVIDN